MPTSSHVYSSLRVVIALLLRDFIPFLQAFFLKEHDFQQDKAQRKRS